MVVYSTNFAPSDRTIALPSQSPGNGGSVIELGNQVALVVEAEDDPDFAADY